VHDFSTEMDHQAGTTADNSAETTRGGGEPFNSTMATWRSPDRQSVPPEFLAAMGMLIASLGICANSVVLAVLVRARKQFGSSVHTLIANQSVMDLFACVFAMASYIAMITHGFRYNDQNKITEGFICCFLESAVLSVVGLTAEKIGLVVITIERYFKIVHAIAHRKYYRDWMTKVGVALPWIGGACLILFPAIGTTRVVNRRCLRLSVWPNKAMALVRLRVF